MSRSSRDVPHNGGRVNVSPENRDRFRRGVVPKPIETGSGAFGEEVWGMKAKRLAKRDRAKKERSRQWDDVDEWMTE